MPTYLIKRDILGASMLSPADLRDISVKSYVVVAGLGQGFSWITSHVARDKVHFVHDADSPQTVCRHNELGGLPVTRVTEISAVVGPGTGKV